MAQSGKKFYGRGHTNFSSKISTIIFDLDNTLIQTRKADVKAVNKVIANQLSVTNSKCHIVN